MKYSIIIAVFLAVGLCEGVVRDGPCPVRPVAQYFDFASYLGVWYEERRYDDEFQADGDCVTAEYRLNDDGSVAVRNSLVWLNNQTFHQMDGRALISFPNADILEGRLNVTFFPEQPNANNYNVLDTDYINYAVVYGCFPIGNNKIKENLWVLARQNYIQDWTIEEHILNIIAEHFDYDLTRLTEQGEMCHGSGAAW